MKASPQNIEAALALIERVVDDAKQTAETVAKIARGAIAALRSKDPRTNLHELEKQLAKQDAAADAALAEKFPAA